MIVCLWSLFAQSDRWYMMVYQNYFILEKLSGQSKKEIKGKLYLFLFVSVCVCYNLIVFCTEIFHVYELTTKFNNQSSSIVAHLNSCSLIQILHLSVIAFIIQVSESENMEWISYVMSWSQTEIENKGTKLSQAENYLGYQTVLLPTACIVSLFSPCHSLSLFLSLVMLSTFAILLMAKVCYSHSQTFTSQITITHCNSNECLANLLISHHIWS